MKTSKRKYQLKKRADRQDETRMRIIEATVQLHEQLGPAHTSISAIAELADVGRPTVYRHFPDELSLLTACTTHYLDRHVPPDPSTWRAILDPEERLRHGLTELYQWYRDTEQMTFVALRDMPELPAVATVMQPFFEMISAAREELTAGWDASDQVLLHAAIGHALDFSTWRSLARDHQLDDEDVADLMTAMVVAAAQPELAGIA